MREEILKQLRMISDEEEKVLIEKKVDRSIYRDVSSEEAFTGQGQFDSARLLDHGKLITLRKHTRFVHFPPHTHNYVEIVYMCSGSTKHIINGTMIELNEGELLFLNQNSVQEILPASENDIAVNFIVLPEFFDHALHMLESEENLLRDFLVDCMTGANKHSAYLHFKVSDILPIQNLVENLIWTLYNRLPNKRSTNQMTMGLLLLQLLNNTDSLVTDGENEGQQLTLDVLKYIDENYRDGELTDLAGLLHYDVCWLSKEIKRRTGLNYTDLVQAKRLSQAAYLLQTTQIPVTELSAAVGYENASYFHRIFRQKFQCSPKKYRDMKRNSQ